VIKKHPEFDCGFRVLLSTNILPLSVADTVLVATGTETFNSKFNPKLMPALVPPANVGEPVGVESAVAISKVPTEFIL
jgi:hypothetical protein